jgi:hypothetical protein
MLGSLWFPFRQGNRSEYLALYILSALGVVVKVPKEEDIGADFHCSLAHMDGNRMTFHSPFLVQTKSISESTISYGGIDENKRWRKEEINWLFSQEIPLLIGLVDKSNSTLKLYSTSNMWAAYYSSGTVGELVFQPDTPSKLGDPVSMPKGSEVNDWPQGIGDGKRWEVPLGPPLVTISVDDSENKENAMKFRNILSFPLWLEQENITYRRLKVHYSKWPLIINTNKLEEKFGFGVFAAANYTPGANTDDQIKALAPIITTLAMNLKFQQRLTELEQLREIVKMIPDGPELGLLKQQVPELFISNKANE